MGSRARGEGPNASPGLGLTGVRLPANRLGSEPKEFPHPSSVPGAPSLKTGQLGPGRQAGGGSLRPVTQLCVWGGGSDCEKPHPKHPTDTPPRNPTPHTHTHTPILHPTHTPLHTHTTPHIYHIPQTHHPTTTHHTHTHTHTPTLHPPTHTTQHTYYTTLYPPTNIPTRITQAHTLQTHTHTPQHTSVSIPESAALGASALGRAPSSLQTPGRPHCLTFQARGLSQGWEQKTTKAPKVLGGSPSLAQSCSPSVSAETAQRGNFPPA